MYDLSFDLLKEPSDYYQVREVKEWFVQYSVSMLKEEETDHEELTDPLCGFNGVALEESLALEPPTGTGKVYTRKVGHGSKDSQPEDARTL